MGTCLLFGLVLAVSAPPDFETEIAPLFMKRCLGCHNDQDPAGDLSLQTSKGIEGVIQKGKSSESELFRKVAEGQMPPKDKGKSQELSTAEKTLLRDWIDAGAPWPGQRKLGLYEKTTATRGGLDWWSLKPVRKPNRPGLVADHPIDDFWMAMLKTRGLQPAPPADRRTLLRRLSYDLIGLPPTADELDAFASSDDPMAYEKQVDRLLADPRFGERWGRYWLDLVRYADTNGYERDGLKQWAWKYRDYVIDSLNSDKPFDRFVLEQLAGDELPGRTRETLIATGMLRVGTWDDEPNDKLEYTYDRLEDMVQVVSTAFLGMSIKCARCHDHKFDPVTQVDYHKFAAAFWPGDLIGNAETKIDGHEVLAWTDKQGPVAPLRLLKKGDPRQPKQVIDPGFVSMVPHLDRPYDPPANGSTTSGRRLQLAQRITDPTNPLTARVAINRLWQHHFGQGLVRTPDNFGFKGDPPTHPELLDWLAADFVEHGWKAKRIHRLMVTSAAYRQASVHPAEAVYRQSDADNRFLWKANRHRLDAESLRDTLLTRGQGLSPQRGGPGFTPPLSPEAAEGLSKKTGAWSPSPPAEQNRRSVYILHRRSMISPFLSAFDFCDTTRPCAQRDVTLVAPQALTLFNDEFVHQQSRALAESLDKDSPSAPGERVRALWRRALGRDPTATEAQLSLEHLQKMQGQGLSNTAALASLAHVLFNTNEFAYVE